jgi:hypothetical protein
MFGLGKNNASGADCAGSVWIVGHSEAIFLRNNPLLTVRRHPADVTSASGRAIAEERRALYEPVEAR